MTDFEFDQGMQRLMQAFPASSFSAERLKLIYKACRSLPAHNFNRIVDHFISNSRYAPLPKDFLEAAGKERMHLGESTREWTPPPPLRCQVCLDSGVHIAKAKNSGREYFIHCDCGFDNPKRGGHKLTPRWPLPVWSDRDHGLYFERKAIDPKDWEPKAFDPKCATDSLKDKAEEWKLRVQLSVVHWREWHGKQAATTPSGEEGA